MSCDMAAALCIGISTVFGLRKAVKMRNGGEHKAFGAAMLITQPLIWVASLWKQLRFGSDAAFSLGLYIAGITIEGAALSLIFLAIGGKAFAWENAKAFGMALFWVVVMCVLTLIFGN